MLVAVRAPGISHIAARKRIVCRNQNDASQPSIRQYIEKECPLPGLDKRYREQPREATLELNLLDVRRILPPGGRYAFQLTTDTWNSVIADNGQVIVVPFGEKINSTTGQALNKGSYACLCQVTAAQSIGLMASITVVAQERVLVQALAPTVDPAVQRAQAAPLPDRWIYYVRASAVEELAEASSSPAPSHAHIAGHPAGHTDQAGGPGGNRAFGREVQTALRDSTDAASEVLMLMQHMSELIGKVCSGHSGVGVDDTLLSTAETEWDELLHWAQHVDEATREPHGGSTSNPESNSPSDTDSTTASTHDLSSSTRSGSSISAESSVSLKHKLRVACRLSYAPFAAFATAALLGYSEQEVAEKGRHVMQVTDMGVRLEEAAEYLHALKNKASAQLMLRQLGGS